MKLVALLTSAFCLLPSALPQEPPQSAPTSASASMPASEEFIRAVFIGKRFADMKDYEAAFRQVEQEYTDLFNRGRFLYSKNDLDAALELFQTAEQKRPTDPAPVYNQAVILEKLGDFGRATERFHRYEELESDADAKSATDQRL